MATDTTILSKEITRDQFQDVIDFDLKFMIQETPFPSSEAPPPLTLKELDVAKERGDELYWIYTQNNERAGYYWIEQRRGCLFLSALVISSSFRNKRIGRKFLESFDQTALSRGVPRCGLAVIPLNAPAVHLYLSHGYRIVRCDPNYFGSSNPNKFRFVLEKDLQKKETNPPQDKERRLETVRISCLDQSKLMETTQAGFEGVSLIPAKDPGTESFVVFERLTFPSF